MFCVFKILASVGFNQIHDKLCFPMGNILELRFDISLQSYSLKANFKVVFEYKINAISIYNFSKAPVYRARFLSEHLLISFVA